MTASYSDWTYYTSYCALRVRWEYVDYGSTFTINAYLQRWDRYANAAQGSVTLWMTDADSASASFPANSDNQTRDIVSSPSHTFTKGHSTTGISATAGTSSYFATITDSGYYRIGEQMPTWYFTIPTKWNYAVSYDANGGTGAPSGQTKWHDETLSLSDSTPSKEGHTFGGWNTNSSGTGTNYAAGASYTENAPLSLYAKWSINTYTVTFNANGGSGAPPAQTKTWGNALTLSATKPTRTNYKFLGWATSASATSAQYCTGTNNDQNTSYTTESDITLYAVWELAYVAPKVTNLKCFRCDSSGNAADEGTQCYVSFTYVTDTNISSTNYATVTAKVGSNAATTLVAASAQKKGTNTYAGVLPDTGLSTDSTFTVAVAVTDAQGGSTTVSTILSQAFFTLDVLAEGHGIAIGKPASTPNLLDVGMASKFTDVTLTGTLTLPSQSRYYVLAAPTTSGGGVPTFRRLAAADIGSGTLSIARGGTAASTAANALKSIMGGKAILYNNASGTTGTVTLSASAADYDHMRIYAKFQGTATDNFTFCSTDVYSPNGKRVTVMCAGVDNSGITCLYVHTKDVLVSGTSITVQNYGYSWFQSSSATSNTVVIDYSNYMYITRVEAWNEA